MILATAPRSRRDRRQGRRGGPVRRLSRGRIPTLSPHGRNPPQDPGSPRSLSGHHRSPHSPPIGTNPGPATGGRANTPPLAKLHHARARTSRVRPPTRGSGTSGHQTADSARPTCRRQRPHPGGESRRTIRSHPTTRRLCRGAGGLAEGDRRAAGTTAPVSSRSRNFPRARAPGRTRAPARSRT